MGDHIHQDMIVVRLTPPLKETFFAAPSYLDRHGRPQRPKDLLHHNCIRYRYISAQRFAEWQFNDVEGITSVEVKGNLIVNSATAIVDAARDGLGITWLFRPLVEPDLKSGLVETVLDDYAIERPGYFLYYHKGTSRLEILRSFIDFMKLGRGAA
jgi:DNA-binding transcriptional LysR family regulator